MQACYWLFYRILAFLVIAHLAALLVFDHGFVAPDLSMLNGNAVTYFSICPFLLLYRGAVGYAVVKSKRVNSVHSRNSKILVTDALRWVSTVHLLEARQGQKFPYGLLSNVIIVCHPVGRAWPDRCEYCIARGLPCTAPRTKKDFSDSAAAQEGEGNTSETNIESGPQRTENATISVPPIQMPLLEESDFDDPTSSINGLPMPRIKRVKSSARETEPSTVEELEKLRDTIRTMEDEFKEVLKTEKENYQLEIRALNDKHQQELNQQRERYESRIDDLIEIMRKM
ncbi:hypothetical protein M434DRAFT_15440 [Hypoxylon sp. CO27-5]|nr:hypothetical protein M434DRAFT_15440 [Hypoxylon sp. CO27-5]